jgi:hypothetical protein
MPDFDAQAHNDTIEYYRLTLALHQKDPHAAETAEAHRYVETGHKRGNVVITVEHGNKT